MPQISVNDLKNGITLELDNGLFQVIEFQHVKPGKGGAFVRTKIRNLRNAFRVLYRSGLKLADAQAQLAALAQEQPELRAIVEFLPQSTRSIVR